MKRTIAAAIVVAGAVLGADASAQAPQTPAPAAAPAAPAAAPVKAPARAKNASGAPADARVCLEFPTNLQVIQCAEKYRRLKAPA